MKSKKLYKLVKGSGGGDNKNNVSIEMTQSFESASFVAKVRLKAIELFGNGASLNTIGTTYGIHIRHEDLSKNTEIAKTLIKIVELEQKIINLNKTKP